jgi:hypothetical protein
MRVYKVTVHKCQKNMLYFRLIRGVFVIIMVQMQEITHIAPNFPILLS